MKKTMGDFRNAYDKVNEPKTPGNMSKNLIQLKESKSPEAGMDFKKCQNAYDKITGKTPNTQPQEKLNEGVTSQHVITDDQKIRMLGAAHVILEELEKGINKDNVVAKISEIKRIVSLI